MSIRIVRTRNGDDVICQIQEITQEGDKKILGYQLEHPYFVHLDEELTIDGGDSINKISNPTLVMHPYVPLAKEPKVIVRFDEIISAYEPIDTVLEKYTQLTEAAINAQDNTIAEQNGLPDREGDGAG